MVKYVFLLGILSIFSNPLQASILTEIDTEVGPKTISLQAMPYVEKSEAHKMASELDYSKGVVDFSSSSSAVSLHPSVPVLDQGAYGTCVTFASTAAIDAALGQGDDISQQCFLELSRALGNDVWGGAWQSSQVIDPLVKYGAVRQGGCGSSSYPDPWAYITVEDYQKLVDPSIQVQKVKYAYYEPMSVEQVKVAVNAGHYVSFGFGLLNNSSPVSVQGFDVVVKGVKKVGGLWACKQPSDRASYCGSFQAGHEVVVIGYDDSQRLFKIQNSWNVSNGDSGYFYMSYEFFASMMLNATEIWSE